MDRLLLVGISYLLMPLQILGELLKLVEFL
nr:MAG TPA: hypothetical protein [Bacteriophage sp.]